LMTVYGAEAIHAATAAAKTTNGVNPGQYVGELRRVYKNFKVVNVMHMNSVRNADKLWLVLRYQFLTRQQLRLLACDFAERALDRIDEPDPRSFEAIRVARLFAVGQASSEELAAAAYAAAADAVAYAAERQWQIERVIAALGGK
ncbi:hypothetical protein LCGC14_2903940, partial [marine sediment metagenome]